RRSPCETSRSDGTPFGAPTCDPTGERYRDELVSASRGLRLYRANTPTSSRHNAEEPLAAGLAERAQRFPPPRFRFVQELHESAIAAHRLELGAGREGRRHEVAAADSSPEIIEPL